ncbi:MAG: diacylglycerol kinase family protein [Actinomycetaceae bacterium]|nr:diacylglycerol kinase family protein [Actinomycetaceae bacterium]
MSTLRECRTFSNVHFIYNPQSGNQTIQRNVGTLASKLSRVFPHAHVSIEPTAGPADATKYARRVAQQYGSDAVVVIAGGDGSVSEAANGLIGSETPLLVLPYGTGNDLARTLYHGGSNSPHDILEAFRAGEGNVRVEAMDSIRVTGKNVRVSGGQIQQELDYHCVNVISIGLDSRVAIVADSIHRRVPWLLGMSYPIGIVAALTKPRDARMRLVRHSGTEVETVERDYTLCAIGNASYYGGGFLPHPDARINDGLMNLLTARPLALTEIVKLLGKFRFGERIPSDVATYEQADKITIEALSDELVITLDGEGFYADKIDAEVVPGALNVVLPASWNRPQALL